MGRATIIEAMGEGLYRIALDYGKARVETRIDQINGEIDRLDDELTELEDGLPAAQERVDDAAAAVNEAIAAYRASIVPGEDLDTSGIQAAAEELIEATGERDKIRARIELIKIQRQGVKQDLKELQSVITEAEVEAWCADHTIAASGEVATVEVPGEPQHILVAPSAPTPTSTDGRLLARGAMSPEQAYLNAAILPGWQKHKQPYHKGTITRLSGNRCDVDLESVSTANNLDVAPHPSLMDVPIEYMACNGAAFEVGDEVVVKFDPSPKVIGFIKEPRSCCLWPVGAELPDAGEEMVVLDSGTNVSTDFITEAKGDTVHVRRTPTGTAWPNRFSYDESEKGWYATVQASSGEQYVAMSAPASSLFPALPLPRSTTVEYRVRLNRSGTGDFVILSGWDQEVISDSERKLTRTFPEDHDSDGAEVRFGVVARNGGWVEAWFTCVRGAS